jgi:hypothetical protein
MRRLATAATPVLAMLLIPGGAGAARARHALPAKCAPSSHTLLADAQAQVYSTPVDSDGVITLRACVYGQRRSFFAAACNFEEGAPVCASKSHVTLVGTVVASEVDFIPRCCGHEGEESVAEWHVEVRDLRTGWLLHEVPTGTPLKPAPVMWGSVQSWGLSSRAMDRWLGSQMTMSDLQSC